MTSRLQTSAGRRSAATRSRSRVAGETSWARRLRIPLLWIGAARLVLGLIAVPLAPALVDDHFVVLVLLRPTKEVLLAGGFLVRQGKVNPGVILLAAAPLVILGVWNFFVLGRAFSKEIQTGKELGRIGSKVLPRRRIRSFARVLDRKGRRVVFLGRLAAFPSTVLAAAAGASGLRPREFLPADAAGALLSIAEVLVAGYALGAAYKRAGAWLTAIGVVLLVALLVALGRWLRRQ
jgi:membrane protein DedA with SNARE-associated domain